MGGWLGQFGRFAFATVFTAAVGNSVIGLYHLVRPPIVSVTPKLSVNQPQDVALTKLIKSGIKSPQALALDPHKLASLKPLGTFALADKAPPSHFISPEEIPDTDQDQPVRRWMSEWNQRIQSGNKSSDDQAKALENALAQSDLSGGSCIALAEMLRFASDSGPSQSAYGQAIEKIAVQLKGPISPQEELACCDQLASTRYPLWQWHNLKLMHRETGLESAHRSARDGAYFQAVLFHSETGFPLGVPAVDCIKELDRISNLYDAGLMNNVGRDKRAEIDYLRGFLYDSTGDYEKAIYFFQLAISAAGTPTQDTSAKDLVRAIAESRGRHEATAALAEQMHNFFWDEQTVNDLAADILIITGGG